MARFAQACDDAWDDEDKPPENGEFIAFFFSEQEGLARCTLCNVWCSKPWSTAGLRRISALLLC